MSTASAPAQYRDEAAWLVARRGGIGASEVAALFDDPASLTGTMHPWLTRRELYDRKVQPLIEDRPNRDMLRGRVLEPIAADLYAERTGRRVRRQPMRVHPECPKLIASIDRQVLAGDNNPTMCLEIKAPRMRTFGRVKREGLPPYVVLQGQAAAAVWSYPATAFGIFGADDMDILTFDVDADPAVEQSIVEAVGAFWEQHVVPGIPPDEFTADLADLPVVAGSVTYRADDAFAAAARDWAEAKEVADEAQLLRDAAKARLIELVELQPGCYETAEHTHRFYYAPRDGRKTFDQAALRAAGPLDPQKVRASIHSLLDIDEWLDKWGMDLDQFQKQGKGWMDFRGYLLRGEEDL